MTVRIGGHAGAPARFSIGPLTVPIAADVLEQWAAAADPGERIVYAVGPVALPQHATFCLARTLQAEGIANLHNPRRAAGGFDFLAVRRPFSAAPVPIDTVAPDDVLPEDQLLRQLTRCARQQLCCPTNAQLATMSLLPNEDAAAYLLRKLRDRGAIVIHNHGPRERRQIAICGTALITARGPI